MAHILVINNAEPGIREFAIPIENIINECGSSFDFIEYKDCINTNFDQFDGVILTGSPQGDDIIEHHSPFFKWIFDIKKPVFGICAGHHVLGYLYGSEILRSVEPESGDFEVKILKKDVIFEGLPETLRVKQMHNDSIILPGNFELLASSKVCKNQMMKHTERPIYTTQFHPEFYNHDLIRNFIYMCDS